MRRIRQLLDRSKYEINDNINDLRKTKWISEILKCAIISGITITCLFLIRLFSSGNFDGTKLQEYLERNILKYVDAVNIKSQILYNGTYDILSNNKVIFVYSKYTTPESGNLGEEYYEKYGEYYDGICISIFERKERNIIHEILGTEPAYELVFCSNFKRDSIYLQYNDFSFSDLDNNGFTEFCLYTNSYFATTSSYEFMLFSRNNGKWSLIAPSIQKLEKSIKKASNCNVVFNHAFDHQSLNDIDKGTLFVDASVFKLNDLLNKKYYYIFGITDNGKIVFTQNPFNSSFEVCYMFSCSYEDDDLWDEEYIYIMQQFTNKDLFTDPNWNMGEPLISDEEIDFEESGNSYWGIQTQESVFFGPPDQKK